MMGRADSTAATSLYSADYVDWKGWKNLFSPTPQDVATFEAEFAGAPLDGRRVLEIGFGSGAFMAWARQQGAEITGCELIEDLCAAGAEKGYLVRVGSVDSIPTDGVGFDLIVAFDVLEHVPADRLPAFVRSVAERLAPGGLFVARTPNGASPWGLVYQHGDLSHLTALSPGRFQQLADQTGLELLGCANAARIRDPREPQLKWRAKLLLRDNLNRLFSTAYGLWQLPLDPNIVARFRRRR